MTVEIVFCEGWAGRAVVRPLPAASARDRDAEGEQYALVLTGKRPLALVEVCWAAHHAAVWRFDEHGRRDLKVELRRWPDGVLRVREARQWAYESPEDPEFHGDTPEWRTSLWSAAYRPDGTRRVATSGWTGPELELAATSWPAPAFGEWDAVLTDLLGTPVESVPAPDPDTVAAPPAESPWHPPIPLRPAHLDEAFEPGSAFELDGGGVTVEVVDAGELRLPGGRLLVADPDPWLHETEPFVESVPSGAYPVRLSVVRFTDDPDHARVAAVEVVVSDAATVAWGNAWRRGEEELLLGDGEFFGVGVDGGRVALVDPEAAPGFADIVEDAYDEMAADTTGWVYEMETDVANMLVVESGWGDGSYPVWVGRDVEGGLTRFVVDFLVLADAREPH